MAKVCLPTYLPVDGSLLNSTSTGLANRSAYMLVYKRKMTAACQPANPVLPEPNETAATASSSEGELFSGLIGLIWGKPCATSQDKETGSLLSPWCQDETSLITQSNTKLIQDEQVGHSRNYGWECSRDCGRECDRECSPDYDEHSTVLLEYCN